jgi:hypothetical protein
MTIIDRICWSIVRGLLRYLHRRDLVSWIETRSIGPDRYEYSIKLELRRDVDRVTIVYD